jgi:hypothetical protein
MLKTTDYDIFIFRGDNRAKISQLHVIKIAESIKSKNLLELKPIDVTSKMEIIDGQHRLLAAKKLGVPIYYKISDRLEPADIIKMNVIKKWMLDDYLNYYLKNHYPEYIKFEHFLKENNLSLKIGLNLLIGEKKCSQEDFKKGNFIFKSDYATQTIEYCNETIDYIRKTTRYTSYLANSRFWKSLIILLQHDGFNIDKWRVNCKRLVQRFGPRASQREYLKMITDIYNWKSINKIDIINENRDKEDI